MVSFQHVALGCIQDFTSRQAFVRESLLDVDNDWCYKLMTRS
jgi:hypothetical protein